MYILPLLPGLTWRAAQGCAGQAVLGSWALVAAMVFWSYTGTLIAQLTVRHISQPIQTLRDLLDDPGIILYILANISVTEIISVSIFCIIISKVCLRRKYRLKIVHYTRR